MIYYRKISILLIFVFFQLFTLGQDLQKIDSLKSALRVTENTVEEISILLDLSNILKNNNPDTALVFAQQAFKLSEEINSDKGNLKALLLLSEINGLTFNSILGISQAKESIELAKKLNLINERAKANLIIGSIFLNYQDLEKSLDYIYESLRLNEEIDNKIGIGSSYNAIGIAYYLQSNFEKANQYFMMSYNINKEMNDKSLIASDLNNIANVYSSKGEYDKSIPYYIESSEINEQIGDMYGQCINLSNLGDNYHNMGRNELSIIYFEKALDIAETIKNNELLTSCKNNIANYYLEMNNPDSIISYAKESYKISQEHNLKKSMFEAARILHEYYLSNNLDSAYKYAIIQYSTKDSMDIEEATQKITRLELQYEFEKYEQEKQIEQNRRGTIFLISTILIVSVFVVIVILLIARHRVKVKNGRLEKQEIENRLKLRDKELAINVMSVLKKNEMLMSISQELIDLKSKAVKDETKDAINVISKKIRQSSESEIWGEFEIRFKQVHGEFYERLMQQFPELTPSEQKLCAFLRLNMSTKDISELTGQSLSSLEKARYRLRKKMGLPSSKTNLITFLSKL